MDKLAEKRTTYNYPSTFCRIYNFYSSIAHSDFAYKTYDLLIKYDAKKKSIIKMCSISTNFISTYFLVILSDLFKAALFEINNV